jgi:hypothetical protein
MKPNIPLTLIAIFICLFSQGADRPPSSITAYGYAPHSADKEIADSHREALTDALKNAVLQAHVQIDTCATVSNMQIQQQTTHAKAMGYVKSSSVLEAVLLSGDPQIYRIRIQALVLPLPDPANKQNNIQEATCEGKVSATESDADQPAISAQAVQTNPLPIH